MLSTSCELREDAWDLLVSQLPSDYAPKGRRNAEVLSGLQYLCRDGGDFFHHTFMG